MSNKHTRKTFFAKAAAALAGLGLLGGARLAAKPTDVSSDAKTSSSGEALPFTIQADTRAVARSTDSV